MDSMNKPIRVSINRTHKGKYAGPDWGWYNGSFEVMDATPRDLAWFIYQGFAFTPIFEGNRRKKELFREAHHIAFDFDTGDERSSLATIHAEEAFQKWGSFAYSTPSSTEERPKSRAVFIFDEPITDRDLYEDIYRAFLARFYSESPLADVSTKDAARLFFGSEGCRFVAAWKELPVEDAARIAAEWKREQAAEEARRRAERKVIAVSPIDGGSDFDRAFRRMMDNLAVAPDGQKHAALTKYAFAAGGYVASGYIDMASARAALIDAVGRMSNVANMRSAIKTIDDCLMDGMKKPLVLEREMDSVESQWVSEIHPDIVLTPEQKEREVEALSRIRESAFLDGLRAGLQVGQELWEVRGVPPSMIQVWDLGYDATRGALTVPFFDAEGKLQNVEYWIDGRPSYEVEGHPALFYTEYSSSPALTLLVDSSVGAMTAYTRLNAHGEKYGGETPHIIGLPDMPLTEAAIEEILAVESGKILVVADKSADVMNRGLAPLRGVADFLRLPVGWMRFHPAGFAQMVAQV